MTKLRLQHQHGRSSPQSNLVRSNSARVPGARGDVGMPHDRMEWRVPPLNDRRGIVEEPLHGIPR